MAKIHTDEPTQTALVEGAGDVRQGEVSAHCPEKLQLMSETEARQCIDAIKDRVISIRALLLELESRRGWAALGYSSMSSCMVAEFTKSRPVLVRELKAGRIEKYTLDVPIGTYPESHFRPLAKLKSKQHWKPVLDKAHQLAGDELVTAAHVTQAVNQLLTSDRLTKPALPSKYKAGDLIRIKCIAGALPEQKTWDGCWGIVLSTGNISSVNVLVGGKEVSYMACDLDWNDFNDDVFQHTCERILELWQTELEPIERTVLKELQRRHFFTDLEKQMISLMEAKHLEPECPFPTARNRPTN